MTALGLPDCFEADWRLTSALGPWALLELLVLALLGPGSRSFAEDPLWSVLAGLDGREPMQPPGRGFVGAPVYRMPRHWRAGLEWEPSACRWASAGGRLRLWFEAGCMLAEVPRAGGAPAAQAREELERAGLPITTPLRRAAYAAGPLAQGQWSASAALDRLLGLMLPYLGLRLALALGWRVDDHGRLLALLRLRARIHVSSSHVDLVARMDDISLAARRAGLDRDPGWLVQFGRVVLFHFE